MNLDERLEALTNSMELLQLSQQDTDNKIRQLAIIAEQNEVRVGELTKTTKDLVRVVRAHERRIHTLEN